MGRKKKLQHFAENLTFDNLFQYRYDQLIQQEFKHKGKWHEFFGNKHPLILELGCGKGEYTIGLAKANPNKNYIGIDIKGARIWRGLKTCQDEGLTNVAFVRTRIELINFYFGPGEVDEIWITFPDPQLQGSRERKRLTSEMFLQRYREFLKKDGIIHLKTDSEPLYTYTLEVIAENDHRLLFSTQNLYTHRGEEVVKSIQTFYEKKWLAESIPIKYLRYCLSHG
ncbi:MAG: tRNA (guanosine(46)-N7)-methyltransferase TrmB [Bacteroidetes bacterium]|nr:tRNA (guanosine(46)-N7)-methyltransferase TrmB [Bacteroidales bacterium]MBU1009405.1 tRNA (guanosine(46)-N7)-methyltransferase TrmB [Bacteroidota bacterium]